MDLIGTYISTYYYKMFIFFTNSIKNLTNFVIPPSDECVIYRRKSFQKLKFCYFKVFNIKFMIFCFLYLSVAKRVKEHRPVVSELANVANVEFEVEVFEDGGDSKTIEVPGNISDPGVQSVIQSESRETVYTLTSTSTTDSADPAKTSPTVIVASYVNVYKYQINVSQIPTATQGMQYKYVFFKPGILIGVLGGLLFVIGAIYTIFCRKKSTINYAELKKRQQAIAKHDDSDSFEDIRPKKSKAKSKTSKAKTQPKSQKQTKSKSKSKKGHR